MSITKNYHYILITFLLFFSVALQAAKPLNTNKVTTEKTQATTKTEEEIFRKNLEAAGVTYTLTGNKLDIIINIKDTAAAIPTLGQAGIIPKFKLEDIKNAPLGLSVAVVGVSFTVVMLDFLYSSQPKLDKLRVQTFVLPMNATKKELCYHFNYSRALYKGLNLDSLTPKTFMLTTPGFNFTDWCRTNMEKEAKAR